MTALQKTIVTATIAVLAGVGIYEARQVSQLREQVQTLQQQQAPLVGQIEQLQPERNDATNQTSSELFRLRGEVGVLKRQQAELPGDERRDNLSASQQLSSATNLPVRTYSAKTLRTFPWNQTLVVGGWRTSSGNRTIVCATPKQVDDSAQLEIETHIYEFPEKSASSIGLKYFTRPEQAEESSLTSTMPSEAFASIQAKLNGLKGVTELALPTVKALNGHFAEVPVKGRQSMSGQIYSTGPAITYMPKISPDGQSVTLEIDAKLHFPVSFSTR